MATYYADMTLGNDANAGTQASPWQYAIGMSGYTGAGTLSAGDSMLLKGGEEWRDQETTPSSGSAGSPITFGAYGSGDDPIINGADDIIGVAGDWTEQGDGVWRKNVGATEPLIVVFDSTNVGVNDATPDTEYEWTYSNPNLDVFTAAGDNNPATYYTSIEAGQRDYAIYLSAKDYITITNLTLAGANSYAVDLSGDCDNITISSSDIKHSLCGVGVIGAGWSYITIDSNTIHNTLKYGILVYQDGTDVTISNNTIYSTKWGGDGTESSGIYLDADDSIIERNTIYDCGWNAYAEHGIYIGDCDNVTVRYNKLYSNFAHGLKFSGVTNSLAYYNLVYSNGGSGIQIEKACDTIGVYNNVVYANTAQGIWINTSGTSPNLITLKNNIVQENGNTSYGQISVAAGVTNFASDYNTIYHSGTANVVKYLGVAHNWGEWQGHEFDTHGFNSDPLFVDAANGNFHLQAGSPCINTGVRVGLTRDYEGNLLIGGVVDIGAYDTTPAVRSRRRRRIL